jgi:phosphoserine phosphatase
MKKYEIVVTSNGITFISNFVKKIIGIRDLIETTLNVNNWKKHVANNTANQADE